MRRVGALLGTVVVLGAAPVVVDHPQVDAEVVELGLVGQQFEVGGSGTFEMTLRIPAGLDLGSSAAIVVTAHRPIGSRDAIATVLAGELPRVADRVEVEVSSLARAPGGGLIVSIPLELTTRRRDALRFEQLGIHPVVVELVEGADAIAEVVTFVHRVADDDTAGVPLPVSVAAAVGRPLVLDDDGTVMVDEDLVNDYRRLTDFVEDSPVPLSVRISPGVVDALAEGDAAARAIVERLRNALSRHEVVSRPRWPLDPSAAAVADEQSRFARWLRAGEEVMATRLGVPARRTVTMLDAPLTTGGAQLLGDLGTRLVVMSADEFDGLPGSTGIDTDTSLVIPVDIGSGATLDAMVVDRTAARAFSTATSAPLRDAIRLVAGLVALRDEIEASGDTPARHAVLLATDDLAVPDRRIFEAVAGLVATSSALSPVTLEAVSIRTGSVASTIVTGRPDDPTLPIIGRATLSRDLSTRAAAVASMLPTTDARPAAWQQRIDVIVSSGLADLQVDSIATSMRREFDAVRSSLVLPAGYGFTLTGRRSEIPLKLVNESASSLRVVVRLTSGKLLFPAGDTTVEIPAGDSVELQIPVEARSSGRFPVTLEVRTPIGGELIGAPVPLTATVTALSGLGNLITGVLLLLLLSWWARHLGAQRATARRLAAAGHPATAPPGDVPTTLSEPHDHGGTSDR